jgi:hypothetical protein
MDAPETRYVTVGSADVAYQVLGDGDIDLLYCYGLGSHLEMFWEVPEGSCPKGIVGEDLSVPQNAG